MDIRKVYLILGLLVAIVISYVWVQHQWTVSSKFVLPPAERDTSHVNTTGAWCSGYLSVIPRGRSGNQMSEYAALMGIARRNRLTPLLFKSDMNLIRRTFAMSQMPVVLARNKVHEWRVFHALCGKCGYDSRTEDVQAIMNKSCESEVNIRLDGYFAAHALYAGDLYFNDIEPFIRNEFIPKESFLHEARSFMNKITNSSTKYVNIGIHIRRGDFKKRKQTIHQSYYILGIEYFLRRFGRNVNFFVATDEKKWAKQNINTTQTSRIAFSPFKDYAQDFSLLYLCDHVILSAGTFSWWAGYLNPGTKIIPYQLLRNTSNWMHLQPTLANRTTWFEK